MKIAIILQARMSSTRLPGKVMAQVKGKPLIAYTIERLSKSMHVDNIIVATSDEASDNPIEAYCMEHNIKCVRGNLEDVASRFVQVIQTEGLDAFIRISADSPLIDASLIDAGYEIYRQGDYDIVTNVLKRSFPKGQSFEIFRAQVYIDTYDCLSDKADREHVTPFFYRHQEQFRIYNLESSIGDFGEMNMSIDTQNDFDQFDQLMSEQNRAITSYGWVELVKIYKDAKQHEYQG